MHHRNRNGMNYLFLSVVWFGLLCMTLRVSGQSSAKDGEWPTYGYRRLTAMMRRDGWPVMQADWLPYDRVLGRAQGSDGETGRT